VGLGELEQTFRFHRAGFVKARNQQYPMQPTVEPMLMHRERRAGVDARMIVDKQQIAWFENNLVGKLFVRLHEIVQLTDDCISGSDLGGLVADDEHFAFERETPLRIGERAADDRHRLSDNLCSAERVRLAERKDGLLKGRQFFLADKRNQIPDVEQAGDRLFVGVLAQAVQ